MKESNKKLVLVKNRLFSQLSEKTLLSRSSAAPPKPASTPAVYDQLVHSRKQEIKQILLKRNLGFFKKTKTLPMIYYATAIYPSSAVKLIDIDRIHLPNIHDDSPPTLPKKQMLRRKDLNLQNISSPKLSPIVRNSKLNTPVYSPSPIRKKTATVSKTVATNSPAPATITKTYKSHDDDDPWGIVNAFKNSKQTRQEIKKTVFQAEKSESKSESTSDESIDSWEVYIPGTVTGGKDESQVTGSKINKKSSKKRVTKKHKDNPTEMVTKRQRLMRSVKKQ